MNYFGRGEGLPVNSKGVILGLYVPKVGLHGLIKFGLFTLSVHIPC